jgi:hypothetical protein
MVHNWKIEYGRDSINFSLNILRFPSFQSALVLDADDRFRYMCMLQSWLNNNRDSEFLHEYELNQLQRLIDYLDAVKTPHLGAAELHVLQRDFKLFYEQYDERRGKNFAETFPTLADWYKAL